MPSVNEVLSLTQEAYPNWLQQTEEPGTEVHADFFAPRREYPWHPDAREFTGELSTAVLAGFFSSRVVYYPGAGTDGRALAVFGAPHSAHCFVHIDQMVTPEEVKLMLEPDHENHCDGYTPVLQREFSSNELAELLQLETRPLPPEMRQPFDRQEPNLESSLLTILCRDHDRPPEHGPERLAFLHIQAEAVWVCNNIWGRADSKPFGVILQDHGGGGNWAQFGGAEAPLFKIAQRRMLPEYLLVAQYTEVWPSYESASEMSQREGGGRNMLYRRIE